ncbi:hypothetical protein JZ785_23185 [Alicyclobacillus curvatus]|nr:hypothetical protein JZ785_23185 [Alicyclobacillus curvatus]
MYLPSFHHANWLAAGLFHSMGEVAAADGILAHLHSTLPKLDASNLAWLINALGVMGVPSGIPLLAEATDRLQGLQREDGRWPSEDGEWQDVHTTLESIRALQSFSVSS